MKLWYHCLFMLISLCVDSKSEIILQVMNNSIWFMKQMKFYFLMNVIVESVKCLELK